MTTAYPLAWPDMFPRTKTRAKSQFRTSLAGALKNVRGSLEAFGRESGKPVSEIMLSSNVTLGNESPADPGIAVWFTWDGLQVCIPCDRYAKAEENLQAIHHVLEARRVELRHGTLALVRATMTGFKAIAAGPHWSGVLGVPGTATRADVEAAYRKLAAVRHPDRGGSQAGMAELNAARDQALRELGAAG